jgi:adenine/guanine phosphoribosyltransferase-like PRPP-binding protein
VGAKVCGYGFIAELTDLSGRARLKEKEPVEVLISY